jgi:hypothetical protein
VRYSVLPPPKDSTIWTILDDRDEVIFSGLYQHCEEWLDLADQRDVARGQSSIPATHNVTIRRPVFERATALLNHFWNDCAGEVRVSGEWQSIFLMMLAMIFLTSQFVWPAVVQQMSLIQGTSAVTFGSRQSCAGTHDEACCASSRRLDMVCDAADELY